MQWKASRVLLFSGKTQMQFMNSIVDEFFLCKEVYLSTREKFFISERQQLKNHLSINFLTSRVKFFAIVSQYLSCKTCFAHATVIARVKNIKMAFTLQMTLFVLCRFSLTFHFEFNINMFNICTLCWMSTQLHTCTCTHVHFEYMENPSLPAYICEMERY